MALTLEEKKERQRESDRKYYATNESRRTRSQSAEYQRNHYLTRQREIRSSSEYKAKAAERQRKINSSPEGKARNRKRLLKTQYNLTPEQWAQMFADQGSCCSICKSPEPNSKKGWSTDHCHTTGKVRGILCPLCNKALGLFKDNPATLQNAITYLTENK